MNELAKYIDFGQGVANPGYIWNIKDVMKRAEAGEKLTIGFIGGSITQGSLSSTPQKCYAYLVYEWWVRTFPQAEFKYVNAGIGGTTSQFGVARAQDDLLDTEPDFVIAEFSVNDESTGHFEEAYEGLVRKILSSKSHPALMLVHNVCYNNGASAELVHSRIARHYNIPSVSMQSTLYKALLNCRFDNRRITPDDLHPNDCGHELVSMVITKRLEQIKNTVKAEYETAKSQRAAAQPDAGAAALLPEPLTANAYEDSVRYRNYNSTPELDGFKADMSEQRDITDCFKKGYTASENGACITFKVKGSCIAVQFRKTIHKPAPVAVAVIDGDEANAVTLDANFDETWGDKLELYTLLEHGENKEHTVQIKLVKTSEADASEFYLVSIIASGH